jgi:hypothetical protein
VKELQEERAEAVTQKPHRPDEGLGRPFAIHQVPLVGYLLGVLYINHKYPHSHGRRRKMNRMRKIRPSPSQ